MNYAQLEEPDGLRRGHDRLDGRARGRRRRSERKLVAAVIYNRLHEGMPLGIDATTRFATGNYDEPLTESELAIDSPYNTRTNAGLPPGPIDSPGLASIEAAAHPAKVDYLFYVTKPGTCNELAFAKTEAEFEADVARYELGARSRRRQLAGHLRGIGDAAAGRPRPPGRPLALAGDAERGAGGAGARRGVELRGDRGRARGVRGAGAGDAGRGLRRRQRHRPPQGRGAGAGRRRSRRPRARSAPPTRSASPTARSSADNTDAGGLLRCAARLAGGQAGAGARRRRRRPRGRLGAAARGRRGRRSGTGPSCARGTSARSSAASPSTRPTRPTTS